MLELEYESESDIPTGYRALYAEKDGKFVLRPGGDIRTVDDVTKLQNANRNERTAHDTTKAELAKWADLGELDDVQGKLDKIPELEAAAEGKLDEDQINNLVETRLATRLRPIERERDKLKADNDKQAETIAANDLRENNRFVDDAIRTACKKSGITDEGSIQDAQLLARTQFAVQVDMVEDETVRSMATKDGRDAELWLSDMKETRPRWWPESVGGGSLGGKGGTFTDNPWKGTNRTAQAAARKADPKKAEQMAAAAGKDIYGRPLEIAS